MREMIWKKLSLEAVSIGADDDG